MARRMLIDATHPEETRVVAVQGNRLEEFDYESATKLQLKGNIYLAKVTRVEPSLQAAFVDYGGNRHGFLAFSEIHPDYYRIPIADREDLVEEDQADEEDTGEEEAPVEELGGDEGAEEAVHEAQRRRPRLKRHYKIQEVIKRRQVLLVQVIKEERGNKGAALTTYLSLAGRYCVLMPNTSRGGGVSRKIANPQDRKRLKTVLNDLNTPEGMAVILRTAGQERSKAEIKRDYEYIMRMWDEIRGKTLESTAPMLIHEEASLIRRTIRDLYSKDIDEILVSGDEGYRVAKDFMKAMIPSHAKKVQPYKDDEGVPLFQRYQVESQLNQIYDPMVQLRSGGSIVMHQTEALVAIDVNSGRATRERHIEETALKTNLEAAEEIARQLRLRDMAGLVVIDFIDMEENRNDHAVERKLKEALRRDRARIQVGRISPFGLLEMSRQRLRPSVLEAMTQGCPTCGGIGYIPSTESAALQVLRAIEEEGLRRRSKTITVKTPGSVALYLFNHKRALLAEMEENYAIQVMLETDDSLIPPNYIMTRTAADADEETAAQIPVEREAAGPTPAEEREGRGRKRGRRKKRRFEDEAEGTGSQSADKSSDEAGEADAQEAAQDGPRDDEERGRRRRKRGRRGGRKRREEAEAAESQEAEASEEAQPVEDADASVENADMSDETSADMNDEGPKPAKRARGGRRRRSSKEADATPVEEDGNAVPEDTSVSEADAVPHETTVDEDAPEEKPKRRRASKKGRATKSASRKETPEPSTLEPQSEIVVETLAKAETESAQPISRPEPQPEPQQGEPQQGDSTPTVEPEPEGPPKPKRRGWWNRLAGK